MMRDPVRSTLEYVSAFLRNVTDLSYVELTYTLHIPNVGILGWQSESLSQEAVQALEA